MVKIVDVARHAGVSTATVTRALSDPAKVAELTRSRVLASVARLGYAPNQTAANLRTLRTRKILITLPDVSNPFFSEIIRGAERAAGEAGYSVLLGDTHEDPEREEQYGRMLLQKQADGLIFLGHHLPDTLRSMVETFGARAPIVNGCEFNPELPVSSVHIDNTAASADALEHLYELGHRRIGLITGPMIGPLSASRLAGARLAASRNHGLADLRVEIGEFSIESGFACAERMLAAHPQPTAFFCFSDEIAIGALHALRQSGLRCPADMSLVGFDDIRYARRLDPPLTTVGQPMQEIGRLVVHLLLDILSGEVSSPRRLQLRHRLEVRASTAPPSDLEAAA